MEWHHWTVTFDSSTKERKVFRDGIEIDSDISASNFLGSGNFYIGSDFTSPFHGQIDEFRLWSTARTENEIRENMCIKLTGQEPSLLAYYRFDNFSGTSLMDLSLNDNSGILMNMDDNNWITSGAAIGDVSIYDYTGTNTDDFLVNLSTSDGDQFTATGDGGSYNGIQLYLVNDTPNTSNAPSGWDFITTNHYWGVFPVGNHPTYEIIYNYNYNIPFNDENELRLAYRQDNSVSTYSKTTAIVNANSNTISKNNETRAEYILAALFNVPISPEITISRSPSLS
ncbi:hypothetical protein MHK_000341, partial [Candidatus Magnetomorum sp. HK-1]